MGYDYEQVYGLYTNFEDAATAIRDLMDDGYSSERITVIVNDEDGRLKQYTEEDFDADDVDAENAAGFGAVVGTLTALGIAVLPGVGPVLAAGPLAAALISGIGAATGAATAAAVSEVVDFDIDEDDAKHYAQIIKDGGALLVVDVYDDWTEERVESTMEKYGPVVVEDSD